MRPVFLSLFLVAGVSSLIVPSVLGAPASPFPQAFLESHCVECHDSDVKKGGLDLANLSWEPTVRENFEEWVHIHDRVAKGEMPPEKKPRPAAGDLTAFLSAAGKALHEVSAREQAAHGRTILRRLNRVEYENSLHTLLGIDLPLQAILPEDTPAHGFDTVAEGLRLSTLQIEKYLEAADAAIEVAITLTEAPVQVSGRFSYQDEDGVRENLDTPPGTVKDKASGNKHVVTIKELPHAVVFFSEGDYRARFKKIPLRVAGTYRFRISAYGYQTHGEPVALKVYADNYREKRLLGWFDLPADKARVVELEARLEGNEGIFLGALGVGYDDEGKGVYGIGAADYQGRGLAVEWVEVEGPLQTSWPPPSTKSLFPGVPLREYEKNRQPYRNGKKLAFELAPEDPSSSLKIVVSSFATRAFRRTLEAGEAERFVALAQAAMTEGSSFEEAARVGFKAILTSPQFLLFEEPVGPLNGYALASRLSYFFWSAPPDETLLKLATSGALIRTEVLRREVDRMVMDPRTATGLVRNFTGQWLELRRIDATSPDMKLYPEFDEILKMSMVGETEAYFREMLEQDLDVTHLVKSDFAMLNRRLAEHYGIPGVTGERFQHVSLPGDSLRGGVLTQASILKVTANGTVTSPVLRGAWVMKHLLGLPPLPPPPNVGSVEPDTRGSTTIREQLAKHRNSETCASCHRTMDPPGFALESFDVIGGFRERYRSQEKGDRPTGKLPGRPGVQYKWGPPVDASGILADGRAFTGYEEFRSLLVGERTRLQRTLADNLAIYATGAGLSFSDRQAMDEIVREAEKQGGGIKDLVREVVLSGLFRNK